MKVVPKVIHVAMLCLQALDLPVERDSISSGSGSATGSNHQYPQHLHRMYFNSRTSKDGNSSLVKEMHSVPSKDRMTEKDIFGCDKDLRDDEPYSSYVQFARDRPHEYSYPVVQSEKKYSPSEISNSMTFGGMSCPKKPLQLDPLQLAPPPRLPTKSTGSTKKKRCILL
jgi:hypothetical protein